jgi:hypothetical protein
MSVSALAQGPFGERPSEKTIRGRRSHRVVVEAGDDTLDDRCGSPSQVKRAQRRGQAENVTRSLKLKNNVTGQKQAQ